MKITIESFKGEFGMQAKMTLEFAGKTYSETWKRNEDRSYSTTDKGIITKMEHDGLSAEGTDLEELLEDIEMDEVIELAESENDWI